MSKNVQVKDLKNRNCAQQLGTPSQIVVNDNSYNKFLFL